MRESPVVCFVYFPRNGSAPRVLKVGTPKYTQRREISMQLLTWTYDARTIYNICLSLVYQKKSFVS